MEREYRGVVIESPNLWMPGIPLELLIYLDDTLLDRYSDGYFFCIPHLDHIFIQIAAVVTESS